MSAFDSSLIAADLLKVIKRNPKFISKAFVLGWADMYKWVGKNTKIEAQWQLGGSKFTNLTQPGNRRDTVTDRSFRPSGSLKAEPHIGQIRPGKTDLLFTEQELKKMVLFYMQGLDSAVVDKIPNEQVIISALVDAILTELRKLVLFGGVYHATNTTPQSTMDGWLKLLTDALTGSAPLLIPSANVFAGTTPTDANIIAQVEGVYNLVPGEEKMEPFVAVMSVTNARRYSRAMKTLWQNAIGESTVFKGIDMISDSNTRVVGEPGFGISNKIVVTPLYNFEIGMKNEGDFQKIKFQEDDRDLKVMIDWEIGVDIHDYDRLYSNDLA